MANLRPPVVVAAFVVSLVCGSVACLVEGEVGPAGPPGPVGQAGEADAGMNGSDGTNGTNGTNGSSSTSDAGGDAGGDGGSKPPPPTDGTRIKAKKSTVTTTTTTSDGAKTVSSYEQSTWFDSLRAEPCTFTAAADGKMRCLPTSLAVSDISSGLYFQDAACLQPIAFITKPSSPSSCGTTYIPGPEAPKYMFFTKGGATCGGRGLRPLGSTISPGVNVYLKSGPSCFPTPSNTTAYDYYGVSVEIDATEFVEATTTVTTN